MAEKKPGELEDIDSILSSIEKSSDIILDSVEDVADVDSQSINHIAILKDINLNVSVVLGVKDMPIKEVLALSPKSVLELDRTSGDDVDIYFNNRLMAKGQLVAVDDEYGVKVTEILERIQQDDYLENL